MTTTTTSTGLSQDFDSIMTLNENDKDKDKDKDKEDEEDEVIFCSFTHQQRTNQNCKDFVKCPDCQLIWFASEAVRQLNWQEHRRSCRTMTETELSQIQRDRQTPSQLLLWCNEALQTNYHSKHKDNPESTGSPFVLVVHVLTRLKELLCLNHHSFDKKELQLARQFAIQWNGNFLTDRAGVGWSRTLQLCWQQAPGWTSFLLNKENLMSIPMKERKKQGTLPTLQEQFAADNKGTSSQDSTRLPLVWAKVMDALLFQSLWAYIPEPTAERPRTNHSLALHAIRALMTSWKCPYQRCSMPLVRIERGAYCVSSRNQNGPPGQGRYSILIRAIHHGLVHQVEYFNATDTTPAQDQEFVPGLTLLELFLLIYKDDKTFLIHQPTHDVELLTELLLLSQYPRQLNANTNNNSDYRYAVINGGSRHEQWQAFAPHAKLQVLNAFFEWLDFLDDQVSDLVQDHKNVDIEKVRELGIKLLYVLLGYDTASFLHLCQVAETSKRPVALPRVLQFLDGRRKHLEGRHVIDEFMVTCQQEQTAMGKMMLPTLSDDILNHIASFHSTPPAILISKQEQARRDQALHQIQQRGILELQAPVEYQPRARTHHNAYVFRYTTTNAAAVAARQAQDRARQDRARDRGQAQDRDRTRRGRRHPRHHDLDRLARRHHELVLQEEAEEYRHRTTRRLQQQRFPNEHNNELVLQEQEAEEYRRRLGLLELPIREGEAGGEPAAVLQVNRIRMRRRDPQAPWEHEEEVVIVQRQQQQAEEEGNDNNRH